MKTFNGQFYPGYFSPPKDATLLLSDKTLSIGYHDQAGIPGRQDWSINEVQGDFLFTEQRSRFIQIKTQAEFRVAGREAFEYWEEIKKEAEKSWFQKKRTGNMRRTVALLSAMILAGTLLYVFMVPWLAEQMAAVVSKKTERQLGDSVFEAMQSTQSTDTMATRVLNEFFTELAIETDYSIRITVVKDQMVNAFALPGGQLVVYTGLLESMETYPELAALLSHEFVHVEKRHATRSIFRSMGSDLFITLLFGKSSGLATLVIGQANQLRTLSYSRSLEKEADLEGYRLLKERGIDPAGYDLLFKHLKDASPGTEIPEMISSHPDTDNRMQYIREAARGQVVKEDTRLSSIFTQLKN
ncbi:MAG: M48 family metallopeptidase [Bacteroidetes bacterium]|nr:M48 family metallopeptidase [Bacteroidota bacterium]